MNTSRSLYLFVLASCFTIIFGCELDRVDPECPVVQSISPAAARFGEIVTVTGINFQSGLPGLHKVDVAGQLIDVLDVPDANTLRFKVPVIIKSGLLTVSVNGKPTCTTGKDFTYYFTGTKVELTAGTPENGSCTSPTVNCLTLPMGIALDLTVENDPLLYISDYSNVVVRKFVTARSTFTNVGRFKTTPVCNNYPVTSSTVYFNNPFDVTINKNGDVYVAEDNISTISVIRNRGAGAAERVAGACPRDSRFIDGTCLTARLSSPTGLSIDNDKLYFTDNGRIRVADIVASGCTNIRTINPVNTISQNFRALEVSHARTGQGPIFIADNKEGNIKALSFSERLTTLTQNFSSPNEPMALTLDSRGNIFIAANSRIFVLYTNGELVPLAGTGTEGYTNGTAGDALTARFKKPAGLALDEARGALYVADTQNHVVRKVTFN